MKRLLVAILAPAFTTFLLIWLASLLFLGRNSLIPLSPLLYPNIKTQLQKVYPTKTWSVIETTDSIESVVMYYRERLKYYQWEYIEDFDQFEWNNSVQFCYNTHPRKERIQDSKEVCGAGFAGDYLNFYIYNEQIQIKPNENGLTEIRIP